MVGASTRQWMFGNGNAHQFVTGDSCGTGSSTCARCTVVATVHAGSEVDNASKLRCARPTSVGVAASLSSASPFEVLASFDAFFAFFFPID